MKIITLISGGDVGGAKTHVLSLLQELNKVIRAELICFREGDFAAEARQLGIPTEIVNSGRLFADLSALKKKIAEGDFDLIHCHGSRANFMGSLLKKSLGKPVITTVHSDPRLDYMGRPLGKLVYGSVNAIALRNLDYYVGVSDAMTELLISRNFPPERIFTIYNGLDFDGDNKDFDRKKYLARFGIDADTHVVAGIAARLNPVKDIATLIRGFAEAEKECENLRLLIAGDGEEREMLESLAAELGVSEKIRFLGWVEDMDAFYRALDINALTSLSETFPYALTEGARAWLPTISSSVGGVPYLIDNGINGLLFPPGDFKALGKHLLALARDPYLRQKMGRKLGEKARECYSLEAMRNTQLRIYETVLRHHRRRAERRRDGVTICGAYGRGNAGDDAILEAIINEMHHIDPDLPIVVLSKNPAETRIRYRVSAVYTFNILGFRRAMKRTKLYINGGGSLIQDVTSRRSLFFYLYNIWAAKSLGNRVIMYGCGIGPVNYRFDRWLAGRVINSKVDIITLRERDSLEELRLLGVTKPEILLSADPALTLTPACEETVDSVFLREGIPISGSYICFALRKWPGFEERLKLFAEAAEYAFEKYGLTPVFIPIDSRKDVEASEQVAAKLKAPYHIIKNVMSSGETIGVMARMRAVVSMRLHGLIFAAGNGIPLVGVAYDPKVSAFLRYIGQELYCDLNDVDDRNLKEMIDRAIEKGDDVMELVRSMRHVLEMEKVNTEAARRLLEE